MTPVLFVASIYGFMATFVLYIDSRLVRPDSYGVCLHVTNMSSKRLVLIPVVLLFLVLIWIVLFDML